MGQMIQLSEAASIALHSVAFMARAPEDWFTAGQIAASSGASGNHIAKVLQRLVKSGILRSVRGPHGGFALAKPKSELTFLEIYEAIEGRVSTGACPLHRGVCPFSKCIFGGMLNRVNAEIVDYFRNKTIADFV